MTWWSEWRDVYFQLMSLSTEHGFHVPKGGRIWSAGKMAFLNKEIKGHFDELEEQLWAMRQGLA